MPSNEVMNRWMDSERDMAKLLARRWDEKFRQVASQSSPKSTSEPEAELIDDVQRWIDEDPKRVFLLATEISKIENDMAAAIFAAGPFENVLKKKWVVVKEFAHSLEKDPILASVLSGVWPHAIDQGAAEWQSRFLS
jgi:hypothetical protein